MTTSGILVPLDGSAATEAALLQAERIASSAVDVHLLHVVPPLPPSPGQSSLGVLELHDRAFAYLQEVRGRFPGLHGLDLIRTGEPADAVFRATLGGDLEMISMCTHARSRPARCFMGSVAETVVRRTRLPVLLTRPGLRGPLPAIRRILVPLDGSEESFSIMSSVRRIALRTGAEAVLLHVTERSFAPLPQRGGRSASGIPEEPEPKLLAVEDRLGESDLVSWQVIAEGDTVEAILDQAKSLDADVIAMATHARSGRDRAAFGSVAQAVLRRSERPVLLQRPEVRGSAPEAPANSRPRGRRWADPR